MELLLKATLGSLIVVIVQLMSQTKNYYIAGLIPLFPTFGLIAHYIIGTEGTIGDLKKTLVLGMLSLIPYLVYLMSLYYLVGQFRLFISLLGATICWTISAVFLITFYSKV